MQELIYYPGFEVKDKEWLKLALLYFNRLEPIIPPPGDSYLSEEFHRLQNETDLLSIHRPTEEEGFSATLDAIERVEPILRNPQLFEPIFGGPDFLDHWRNRSAQTARIFRDKYTDNWGYFCLENGLANEAPHGLVMHGQLALLYMTVLAQAISDFKGVPAVTDYGNLDRYGILLHKTLNGRETFRAVQNVVQLSLPANLKDIDIGNIIRLRNRPGFKERQGAFHTALNGYFSNLEEGGDGSAFEESLGSAWRDFRDDILQIGTGAFAFGLGAWVFVSGSQVGIAEGLKEIAGGIALMVGSALTIKNTWHHTAVNRLARKYLCDLRKLEPAKI